MTRLLFASALAGLIIIPANAQEKASSTVEAPDPAAAAIVADCSARKFETSVEIDKAGEKRQTKLKLCGTVGQDDAHWVKTLSDAKAKIAAHPDISADSKAKIASEIDSEIAKVRMGQSKPAAPTVIAKPGPIRPSFTPLPGTPTGSPAATLAAPAAPVAGKKPKLTIKCLAPGEKGGGSTCSSSLNRTTQFAILADDSLGSGASLRFLRRGDAKASLSLAPMRQGEVLRAKLPPELCAGVASTKIEIQVMNASQVVDTVGPYSLRC